MCMFVYVGWCMHLLILVLLVTCYKYFAVYFNPTKYISFWQMTDYSLISTQSSAATYIREIFSFFSVLNEDCMLRGNFDIASKAVRILQQVDIYFFCSKTHFYFVDMTVGILM